MELQNQHGSVINRTHLWIAGLLMGIGLGLISGRLVANPSPEIAVKDHQILESVQNSPKFLSQEFLADPTGFSPTELAVEPQGDSGMEPNKFPGIQAQPLIDQHSKKKIEPEVQPEQIKSSPAFDQLPQVIYQQQIDNLSDEQLLEIESIRQVIEQDEPLLPEDSSFQE